MILDAHCTILCMWAWSKSRRGHCKIFSLASECSTPLIQILDPPLVWVLEKDYQIVHVSAATMQQFMYSVGHGADIIDEAVLLRSL